MAIRSLLGVQAQPHIMSDSGDFSSAATGRIPLTSSNMPPSLIASKHKATFVREDNHGRIKFLRQHVQPELMSLEPLLW
jgi:hypothetical protein